MRLRGVPADRGGRAAIPAASVLREEIMNRRYAAVAMSALAFGAVALTSTEASARIPYEPGPAAVAPHDPAPPNYPEYDPRYEVPRAPAATGQSVSDDTVAEALQAGASALGGAGVALGGLWLYRRRHQPVT
jgi:hypothetical protein